MNIRSRFRDGILFDLLPSEFTPLVCHSQINGQDVQNRQEAVAALSSDECTSIVLLVARPETQVRDRRRIEARLGHAQTHPGGRGLCSVNDLASPSIVIHPHTSN